MIVNKMNKLQIASLLVFLASCSRKTLATVDECKYANGEFHKTNDELEKATNAMWTKYENACEDAQICEHKKENSVGSITLDFKQLRATDEYAEVRKACHATGTEDNPSTLCKVNTKMVLQNGKFPYTVKKEPVCFPHQCQERQVEMVDSLPMGCDPSSEGCGIISQTAVCDGRIPSAGSGNCNKYQGIVNDDETYKSAKTALVTKAETNCDGVSSDNPDANPICKFEKASIDIVMIENFRPFERDLSYTNYLDNCYDVGGHTCFMNMNMKLTGNIFYDIDVLTDFNDYPACFTPSCMHTEKEAIMKEYLGSRVADSVSAAINEMMSSEGGDRKLLLKENPLHEDAMRRILKGSCPLGMTECTATVVDFYCTGRDGVAIESIDNLGGSSAASSLAAGSFMTAMAMGGAMLF